MNTFYPINNLYTFFYGPKLVYVFTNYVSIRNIISNCLDLIIGTFSTQIRLVNLIYNDIVSNNFKRNTYTTFSWPATLNVKNNNV